MQGIPGVFIFKFKDAFLISVDYMGILVLIIPFMVNAIRQMHMPMKEKLGLIFFN